MAEEIITLSQIKDGLVRIAMIYTGDKFKKDGQEFSVTERDLKDIQANLNRREVMIDYEHYSAQPVPPGWSKAAGWIKRADEIETLDDGRKVLYGWAEFTPAMLSLIANKEYRYFSAEPHWNSKDEHGKAIGTNMAAAAMTNRPFQKSLPPIEIDPTLYPQLLEAVALSESKRLIDDGARKLAEEKLKSERTVTMKEMKFKKLTDGEHKGKTGIFDGDDMVGFCDTAKMRTYMSESGEDVQMTESVRLAEVQRGVLVVCFSELAKATTSEAAIMLCEKFVEEGKFDTRALVRAQKIERLVSKSIEEGKILPKQRAAMFSLASADFDSAVALLSETKPAIDLKSHGIEGDGATGSAAKVELEEKIRAFMTENKASYADAMRGVTLRDPKLYERYQNSLKPVNGDAIQ